MPTILCIDDEVESLQTRKSLLESQGYQVITVNSGKEGLQVVESTPVDVAIVDDYMPGMRGMEVASNIKKINPAIPIIMLSGWGELPSESAGIAFRWVLKGSPPDELLATIKRLTQKR